MDIKYKLSNNRERGSEGEKVLTEYCEGKFCLKRRWAHDVASFASVSSLIVASICGKRVDILAHPSSSPISHTNLFAITIPDQLSWGIPPSAAAHKFYRLATTDVLAFGVTLDIRYSRRIYNYKKYISQMVYDVSMYHFY